MGIEQNIKSIRSHQTSSRTKTAGELKGILAWQKTHTRENNKQFKQIGDALKSLPSEDVILKSISDNIKITVNGKIDKIALNVTDLGEHLKQQDLAIETINNKIKPVVGSMEWFSTTVRLFLWIGGIAAAAYGILRVLEILKITQ
jgi:ATP-dependent 26S proteasome regulatory subunit